MKFVKNNHGYTLIWTLLIITIIGVLTPPLVSSAISSAKQNKITEESNQIVKQADMGGFYFQQLIDKLKPELKAVLEDSLNQYEIIFRKELEEKYKNEKNKHEIIENAVKIALIKKKEEYVADIATYLNNFFSSNSARSQLSLEYASSDLGGLINLNLPLKNEDYPYYIDVDEPIPSNNTIYITYTSFSKMNTITEQSAQISESIIIDFDDFSGGSGGSDDSDEPGQTIDDRCKIDRTEQNNYTKLETKEKKNAWKVNNNESYFIDGDLTINGKLTIMNQGKLWVTGNLVVLGDLEINNKSEFIVEGKLTYTGKRKYTGSDGHGRFCVEGKLIKKD